MSSRSVGARRGRSSPRGAARASRADAAVAGGDRAWWFEFGADRRTAIDVVELDVRDGRLLPGFVNGLPLVFVELKASHRRLEDAYRNNLRDYRNTVPHLSWYNGVIILSNGSASRIGSTTAVWEHFGEWKRINNEGEQGVVSLETMIRGTCDPARLLDIVENFTVFDESTGGLIKKLGRNHQGHVSRTYRAAGPAQQHGATTAPRGRLSR